MARTSVEFADFIYNKMDELKNLFREKNEQYATKDCLHNFRQGALLQYGKDDYESMYKTLQGYEAKHITQAFKDIDASKAEESLGDIVIYSLIAMYMIKKHKEEQNNVNI